MSRFVWLLIIRKSAWLFLINHCFKCILKTAAGGDTAYCEAEWRQDILWSHTVASAVDIKTCPQDFLPGKPNSMHTSSVKTVTKLYMF